MRTLSVFGDIDPTLALFGLTDERGNYLTDETDGAVLVDDKYRSVAQPPEKVFEALVNKSHTLAIRADIVFNGETIDTDIPLGGGRVTLDRTAARRARVSNVTISDPFNVPASSGDMFNPFGYELQIWRGISFARGSIMAPLGLFPIQKSEMDGVSLVKQITGEDRSRRISDARFEDDYPIAAGTNYAEAIMDVLDDGVSGLTYLFPSTSFTTPALVFTSQDDRWEAAVGMAKSIGMELLFDGLGRVEMRPVPTFAQNPTATIAEGLNMLAASVQLDRGPAYNRVIAASNNASLGTVYRGVATDDDPSSPTYYFGPFGKKPMFYSSSFLSSTEQCETAAAGILASNLGVARSADFSALTDPRIEPSDVVTLTREVIGLDGVQIIQRQEIGLGPEAPMTGSVRAQQVAA